MLASKRNDLLGIWAFRDGDPFAERRNYCLAHRITRASLDDFVVNGGRNHQSAVNPPKEIEIRQDCQVIQRAAVGNDRTHSPPALRAVLTPTPQHLKVFVIELPTKPHTASAQEVEEFDTRQTQHLRRFAGGYSLLGVKLQRSLRLDGTHQFGFGALVHRAVRKLKLES